MRVGGLPERRRAHAARNIGHIGHHGGRGRHAAGARPDQRDRRKAVGVDRHGVGHAHHLRDRGVLRHHGRMHALLDALVGAHRDAEQLHAVAEFVGRIEIGGRDRRNALHINRRRIDLGAEGEARKDRRASARCRGPRCRRSDRPRHSRAAARRFRQSANDSPSSLHARQDVIAGAVEDAVDARERVADEPFAQRLDDRDAAGDRRLEIERHALALGERRKLARRALASSALLAVTTGLPAASAVSTARLAGSPAPPISSTNTSMPGSPRKRHRIVDPAHLLQIDRRASCRASARCTATISIGRPQRATSLSRCALDQLRSRPRRPCRDRQDRLSTAQP